MERGILFSRAEKDDLEYERSFGFGEVVKSKFWDKQEQLYPSQREVTCKEGQYYDEIMDKIISVQFS